MVRFVVPVALALVLPSCGGSDVSCSYGSAGVQIGCADVMSSGDTQGVDVTSEEQDVCTSSGGTVVGSCPTTNTLGTCTFMESGNGVTVSSVEYFYAVDGLTAAVAEADCTKENGMDGVTATWSAP